MEIIAIANHIVKPSSPTPHKFKTHKLSTIDQLAPSTYIPLIFFYANDESKHEHEQISRRLKQSLSETLTIFYPLAGTIKQNSLVDCDDRGADFVEARVHARLDQLIQNPKMEELMKQLVPTDGTSTAILSVKTSYLDCGGIAVGVSLSHKIGDGASFVAFMNAWAATCRGECSRIIHPSFDLALHFPPSRDLPPLTEDTKEEITTKSLVFEREKIEKLRAEAMSSSSSSSVSRVEAVSAFIWRSFIEANKGKGIAFLSVNLRPRTVPPLPEQTFGNCANAVMVLPPSEDDDLEYYVSKLRAAIRGVDDDYINKVVKSDQYCSLVVANRAAGIFDPSECCAFTSWRFPVYDVDFGWGKPVRVSTTPMPFANLVVLMDTPSGDGVEALVNFPHHHHHFFQILQANYNNLVVNMDIESEVIADEGKETEKIELIGDYLFENGDRLSETLNSG